MEWISLEDNLPDSDKDVLVTDGHIVCAAAYYILNSGDKIWCPCKMCGKADIAITHWIPFPQPPSNK